MPAAAKVCGKTSVLNCGLNRERGTVRTSISRSTADSWSSVISSSAVRVEWPMVKTGLAVLTPGSRRIGCQIVVDLLGAHRRRASVDPGDIALERRPFLEGAEL